ncbi:type-F conjugative transfer system pilin assembly protein TrbC [Massilia sp. CCM 8734]|uniref:type-F conjugative transfer system pilin assembly protein TrbC n=1 Tax=Massilia sp. CCM 8734 TaxID=2609283 RepID=UPI0014228899|nr:type-F conjugative transfer system pilin assembly protein TrbC [Massilia sp. CCM 8734]NHZ99052.1 type-F conjugative transfer system pilin assembly protein TrbC [Massilia sp. CCM 8734]
MNSPTLLSRAKVTIVLLAAASLAAAQSSMPDNAAIARHAATQAPRSAAAISKAEQQSKKLRQPVPDVSAPTALPALDPASIAKRYEGMGPAEESGLFIMVSFSMPRESIERLASQANKAGATLVLRGMVDDSLKKTAETVADFLKRYPGAQFQIDPTVFKRFAVAQVPAFVISTRPPDTSTCGKECDPRNTFSSVAGDVTLDYALEYLAKQRDGRFAALAETRLKRLRSAP